MRRPRGQLYRHTGKIKNTVDPPDWSEALAQSPIEREVCATLVRYLNRNRVSLIQQKRVSTRLGVFFLDIVLESGEMRLAVECDGAEFHDMRRDLLRDVAVLMTGQFGAVWRLPGRSIHHALHDFLLLMAETHPEFFEPAGLRNLESLASDVALAYRNTGLLERNQGIRLPPIGSPYSDDFNSPDRELEATRLIWKTRSDRIRQIEDLLEEHQAASIDDALERVPLLSELIEQAKWSMRGVWDEWYDIGKYLRE